MTEKDNEKEVEDTFKDILRGLEKSKLPMKINKETGEVSFSKEDNEG